MLHRKKIIAVTLVASLCLQMTAVPVFAAGNDADVNSEIMYDTGAYDSLAKSSVFPLASGSDARDENQESYEKATRSNALRTEAFSIEVESGYGVNEIFWTEESAVGYLVSRSEEEDGTFIKIADLAAAERSYKDQTGPDMKYYYKVTAKSAEENLESLVAEAETTGLKALQKNAVIHKSFETGNQSFDGTRVENLSIASPSTAEKLQGMDKGTVIMKIKPSSLPPAAGVILGLKDNSVSVPVGDLPSNPLTGKKTAAIMERTDGSIRYSFHHTRAYSAAGIFTPEEWITVVFTNAGPEASKVLRLYAGGKDGGSFSGGNNAGFFSKTNVNVEDASVTIGGLLEPNGSVAAGFKGQIAYVTVTDELLTDKEAQEISAGVGESAIKNAFDMNQKSNTWVITGGRNAQGKFEDIQGVRNYSGLFEEVIRWDQSSNQRNGLQRFVINTAQEGNTIETINQEYERLIGDYQPTGVAVMLESEDVALDPETVVANLEEIIDKNHEGETPIYTVIQLPVPSLDETQNQRIEALATAVDSMMESMDSSFFKHVVVVNHYVELKSRDMTKLLTEEGYLNGDGHLDVANQLLEATIGSKSKVTKSDRTVLQAKEKRNELEEEKELSDLQQELAELLVREEPVRWLFLGDSITHGAAHTLGYDSVPQLFEKYVREELDRPGDVVINTGVSGATSVDFMKNKEERYTRYEDADVVILMFGSNDAKDQVVGTGSYRQNLEEIIEDVRSQGAIPIIRTPNKLNSSTENRGTNLPKYVNVARDVAEEYGCILVDHYDFWERNLYAQSYLNSPGKFWQNDNIHPNGIGQLKMLQNLLQAMGIDRQDSELCQLDYVIKTTTASRGIIPLVKTTETSITADVTYLQKQAGEGAFGEVTLTGVSDGITYQKTLRRDSISDIKTITLEDLPTGQRFAITVEASLVNAPKTIRFQTRSFVLDGTINEGVPGEIEGLIWEENEVRLDGTRENAIDLSDQAEIFQSMTEGTFTFRFRVDDPDQSSDAGLQTLFSISKGSVDNVYANFFVLPMSGEIGLEMKNGSSSSVSVKSGKINMNNKDWHTASYVYDKTAKTIKIYVDGVNVLETACSFFFSDMTDADTVRIGNMKRGGRGDHLWVFKGDMNLFQVYDKALSEEEIIDIHQATIAADQEVELPDTAMITDPVDVFYGGYLDSQFYRIPSLLTTKNGTLIAAVDQRKNGSGDAGDIATVIRRSQDGGKTWGETQSLIDLPYGNSFHSFTIDAEMLQDENTGTVFLLVDMFPESTALMGGSTITKPTSGYRTVDGTRYLQLNGNGGVYTLRKDGTVYLEQGDGNSVLSDYTVPEQHTGQLYKNGEKAGNIYLYTGADAGELSIEKTAYLWLISSDDDGATWSAPVCLNGQVKADWMVFLGTGPGTGIQMKKGEHKGRLIFPVYYTNKNGLAGSQSSAVIYSDDGGTTWEMGESPNDGRDGMNTETMNNSGKVLTESQAIEVGDQGMLKLFCRNSSGRAMVATSEDGGETWDDTVVPDPQLYDSYCQMSVISYPKELDGKPAYVFSNPASSGRNNGTVRIGFYDEETDTFDWKYSQMFHEGRYQYSSLAVMPNGEIGVFYEGDQPNMRFVRMTPDWIMASRSVSEGKVKIADVAMEKEEDRVIFQVEFTRPMIKTGYPSLRIEVDGQKKTAQYLSGNAETTYRFAYTPQAEEKEAAVINVFAEESSYIGDSYNDLPEDVRIVFALSEKHEDQNLEDVVGDLNEILNRPDATAQEKNEAVVGAAQALQNMTFQNGAVTNKEMDLIADVERAFLWNNPNALDSRVDSDWNIQIRGAALSIPAGIQEPSKIAVSAQKTALPQHLPDHLDSNALAMDVRMNLEGIRGTTSENIQPLVPFEMTLTLPEGIKEEGLVVLHFHDGEMTELPVRTENGRAKIIVSKLSVIVFANEKADTPVKPPVYGSGKASTPKVTQLYGTWIKDQTGWWFSMTDGNYPMDQWGMIRGTWYHFDKRGYMQTGWLLDTDGRWYYLQEDGAMASSKWVLDQNKWYYMMENGAMAVNTMVPGFYQIGADGVWME